ncbi:MAG TPA: glycosyltransferase family 1 protein, partial [Spirochaetales bacterium]|nr:glycosyltransferase family 1 protein [Spirochaetales bacterium]
MAKETPARYEPGELKNIRKRLGALTRDEAGKMTKILGGEIGRERTDEKIEKKYKRIKNLAKRSSDHIVSSKNREQRRPASTDAAKKSERLKNKKYASEQTSIEQTHIKQTHIEQFKYFDRLKYNFMCQRHPAKLKTLSQAALSIFSFLIKRPDYINPLFIENADILLVKSIEELVLAVRSLLSSPNRIVIQEIARNSFYDNILTTLKDWDLTGIRREISKLQESGKKIEIAMLKKLCLMVCRPLVVLMNLNSQTHILPAIKRAYDVNMVFAQEQGAVKEIIIRNSFSTARKKLSVVSIEVKRIFYPILLRFSSNRFIAFEDFFANNFKGIISFLNLSEEDILKPEVGKRNLSPRKLKAGLDKADKADKERPDTNGSEKESSEKEGDEKAAIPERARRGMMFLELLFPGAGWEKLAEFPDLFSYFQPLFKYPPGFELISKRDPMQQIMILVSILDYLFAGFRNINFGVLQTSGGEPRPIQGIFDNLIQTWPLFLNKIIYGLYISRLQDYCSQIEQNSAFEISDSAQKIEEQVNWIKRAYFLPFYSFKQRYPDVV